jgi:hypothetical protein
VTFSAAPGNGTVTNGSQVTAATGKASVGGWRLGNDNVPYPLVASGAVTAPVTFTATGRTITTTVTGLPPSDAKTGIGVSIAPFLTSATATASGGNLTLSLSIGPGTFDLGTNHFIFNLDTDRNPSTGLLGLDNGATPYNLGTDFLVEMGSMSEGAGVVNGVQVGGNARVLKYPSWTQVASAPVTLLKDANGVLYGLSTTIPLATFANSDGQLNFVVEAETQLLNCPAGVAFCGYTGVEDYLPNFYVVATLALPPPIP